MSGVTVITRVGLAACAKAGLYGPQITINKVKVGSTLMQDVTSEVTEIKNIVWTGGTDAIRYQVLNESTILFKVLLDESVGDFDIGTIGLYLDSGELFAVVSLPAITNKIQNSLPEVVGNRRTFNIPIILSGIATITDLSVLIADEASIPIVQHETDLPDCMCAPFSVYSVLYNTIYSKPTLAIRTDTTWWYCVACLGESQGYQFSASDFDTVDPPKVGECVRFKQITKSETEKSGLFVKADSSDLDNGYFGIRAENNCVVVDGIYTDPNYDADEQGFTIGTKYYVGTGTEYGKIVETESAWYVGIAVDVDKLMLNVQEIIKSTKEIPGHVQLATMQEIELGNDETKATTPYAVARTIHKYIPNQIDNGQFFNINETAQTIPSWKLEKDGSSTSVFKFTRGEHEIGKEEDWIEGPIDFIHLYNSTVATTEQDKYNKFYNRQPNANMFDSVHRTLSFRVKATDLANNTEIVPKIIVKIKINFGTGGSPSTEICPEGFEKEFTITDEWDVYTLSYLMPELTGYTWGTNKDSYVEFGFLIPTNATYGIDVDYVKLEPGAVTTLLRADSSQYCLQDNYQYITSKWDFKELNIEKATITDLTSTNYYNKQAIDDKLVLKADKTQLADYYTKTESDTQLDLKADKTELANYVTQTVLNNLLAKKFQVVDSLPATPEEDVFYFVKKSV